MTAHNPVEVLTIEQYQEARHSGKQFSPGTLVLVPASLLQELQEPRSEQGPVRAKAKSEDESIVEMTYVGKHTSDFLWQVKRGQETLATLKRLQRIWGNVPGDATLSRHEAISLLERSQSIQKTPKELEGDLAEYQIALRNIEREPDAYVAPEIARDWYEQQIERVRQLLQKTLILTKGQEPYG